jgi:Family of unknown function (DUF6364)
VTVGPDPIAAPRAPTGPSLAVGVTPSRLKTRPFGKIINDQRLWSVSPVGGRKLQAGHALHCLRAARVTSMANLTLKIDEKLLRRARIRALEQGTTVNELVRNYLSQYAVARADRLGALRRFLEIAEEAKAGSGGRKLKREELYDR